MVRNTPVLTGASNFDCMQSSHHNLSNSVGGISQRRHQLQAIELFTIIMCSQSCGGMSKRRWDQRAEPDIHLAGEVARSQWAAQGLILEVNLVFHCPDTMALGAGLTIKVRPRPASDARLKYHCEVRSR